MKFENNQEETNKIVEKNSKSKSKSLCQYNDYRDISLISIITIIILQLTFFVYYSFITLLLLLFTTICFILGYNTNKNRTLKLSFIYLFFSLIFSSWYTKKTNISIEWIRWNDQFILVILRKFIIKTKDKTLIHQKRNSQYIYIYTLVASIYNETNKKLILTMKINWLQITNLYIYKKKWRKKTTKSNYFVNMFDIVVFVANIMFIVIYYYIYELCIYITNFKRNMYLIKTFQINSIQEDNKSLSFKKNDIFHLNSFVKCCVCYFFSFSKANLSICWCFTEPFAYNCIY